VRREVTTCSSAAAIFLIGQGPIRGTIAQREGEEWDPSGNSRPRYRSKSAQIDQIWELNFTNSKLDRLPGYGGIKYDRKTPGAARRVLWQVTIARLQPRGTEQCLVIELSEKNRLSHLQTGCQSGVKLAKRSDRLTIHFQPGPRRSTWVQPGDTVSRLHSVAPPAQADQRAPLSLSLQVVELGSRSSLLPVTFVSGSGCNQCQSFYLGWPFLRRGAESPGVAGLDPLSKKHLPISKRRNIAGAMIEVMLERAK
jgi:hypothetical protein